jgi:hypothetical protein
MLRIIFVLSIFSQSAFAISTINDSLSTTYEQFEKNKKDGKYLRDKTLIPLPVAFRFPETGWGGGALVSQTFRFTRDSINSKPSQISIAATYTERKQILLYLPFSVFYNNNKYFFNGEVGWFRYNFKYFGVGENKVTEEDFGVDYPRIRLQAVKQIRPNLYAGIRFQFENYDVTSRQIDGELITNRIPGSDYSRTIGLGLSILKDSRDIVYYPRKGVFAEFYLLPTLKLYGADRNFNRVVIDFAHYKSLSKKIVFASNLYGSFIQGKDTPFNQLSLLGGPKKLRGIFEGQYRDKNAMIAQAEARFEVWKFLGFTTFGSLGFIGNEDDFIRFNKPKYTFGGGLRITAIKKDHINIRIDYGLEPGKTGNFYFTVGEAF